MAGQTGSSHRLTLVEPGKGTSVATDTLKLAFASSDNRMIDQHFGAAESFAIFHVTRDDLVLGEVVRFDASAQDGNEDKLGVRIAALSGCAAVYCCAMGASAIAQLRAEGVEPLKTGAGEAIKAQIALLQEDWRTAPPRWLLRALAGGKASSRFDEMAEQGWVE